VSFDDKIALVTGAGSGIGRASAIAFASRGARVVVADVNADGGNATVKEIAAAGGEAIFVQANVTRSDEVAALVASAVDQYGRLDYAHNNAGMSGTVAATADVTEHDWDRIVAVNLTSVFLCIKHEVPAMLAGGGGAIVNTASGAGLIGFAGLPGYVATKHGVVGLTKAAALEYAGAGIRINAVCPGNTRTAMLEGYIGGDPKVERMMTNTTPLRRLAAPEEIAAAVVWLCSDEASFVIGTAMPVDGGAVAQ
jgi:NAD(P)-dependent dehydrogenase (short-subunit alcohol dehydrogenase family)